VSSVYMVRDIAGAEYKPEDYLRAFERFVREHKTHDRCDPHLLDRPRELECIRAEECGTNSPTTLALHRREPPAGAQAKHHKPLVDIISMVKTGCPFTRPRCSPRLSA